MEFKLDRNILSEAVASLNNYTDKKSNDVTSNILIKIEDGIFKAYATDYEYGLNLEIVNVFDGVDGEFLINSANFLNTLKRLKNGEVHIKLIGNSISINQGKAKLKLEVADNKNFPLFDYDEDKMETLQLNSNEVVMGIKKCMFAVDSNNPKYELGCLLFDFDDTLKIVATDTRVLTIYDTKLNFDGKFQLLISKKSIVEIQKILNEKSTILFDNTNLIIKNENLLFYTKLVNGKFPQYQRVIPTDRNNVFNLNTGEFIDSIKTITALENIIKLSFDSDVLLLESFSEKNKSSIEMDCKGTGSIHVKASAINLINTVSNIEDKEFTIIVNSENLPITIDSDNYKVIAMPVVE